MGHWDKEEQDPAQRSWIQSDQTHILTNFRQNFTRLRGDTCQNFLNTHNRFSSRSSALMYTEYRFALCCDDGGIEIYFM